MGRIIVFIAGIFVLAVVVFTVYTVYGIIAERYKENAERKQEEKRRKAEVKAVRDEIEAVSKAQNGTVSHDMDMTKCPRCSKRSYCKKYQSYLSEMENNRTWFSVLYPNLSNDDGHAVSDAVAALFDTASKEVVARTTASKLPKGYRDTLDSIASRMEQIRERTDDASINNVLASYCDSIESSTLSYVDLVNAPVKSEAMEKTMREIEDAINGVPATLDAILASTYEQDAMKALIEAGALKAVIEHNKTMFSGNGNFVSNELVSMLDNDANAKAGDVNVEELYSEPTDDTMQIDVEKAFKEKRNRDERHGSSTVIRF